PTAFVNWNLERQVVDFPIGFNFAGSDRLTVHNDLDQPLAATDHLVKPPSVQIDGVADNAAPGGRRHAAVCDRLRSLGGERHASGDLDATRRSQLHSSFTRPHPTDLKLDRVSVSVGNVGAARADAFTPGGIAKLLGIAEPDIDTPLADVATAHAGKIRLAAGFQGKAAV